MNTSTQQTISDSVLELQLKEVNEKARKGLDELKAINASIDTDYLSENSEPEVGIKTTEESDAKELEDITADFLAKAEGIFKDEIGE